MMPKTIIKRDGREVPFDATKITAAVAKALAVTGEADLKLASDVTNRVLQKLQVQRVDLPSVEGVQDLVEESLMEMGFLKTARAYILYRNQRTRIREAKSDLMDAVEEIVKETHRENANVGNSPASKMFQIAETASKKYYLTRLIPKDFAQAHVQGDIHIHDLGYYGKTVNCLQIPLGKLLAEGFSNGHGYIRPPKRPASAAALACIILQSSQNDMFGGQSFAFFDRDMAPYVENATEDEVYQAMEALVYNLNSMQSRAGNQVPFSSINLGTETSEAARRVTRSLLLAYDAGLGKGEAPIFPNIIFRVKKGVNFAPGDPNYDLFQLAIRVAAKRLNPTFSFMDASFNAPYGDQVAYMGCVDGDELVIYRKGKTVYMESIRRLHERAVAEFGLKREGETKYADVTGYELYDTNRGFVPLFRTLKNPDHNDWYLVRLSNGRSIEVTSDHRWAVLERGVVLTKDLRVGDLVQVAWRTPGLGKCARRANPGERGLKKAYLMGLLLCDGTWNGKQVICSLHKDDTGLTEAYRGYMREVFKKEVTSSLLHDERRGYVHQLLYCGSNGGEQGIPNLASYLTKVFEGRLKPERHMPRNILNWSREVRLWFLAGMVDGDGYIKTDSDNGGSRVQFHITSKEVALQTVGLAQSLGYPARLEARADGTFLVEFGAAEELVTLLQSRRKENFRKPTRVKEPEIVSVVEIRPLVTNGTKPSYCVTTASGFMMCSFIHIGQCRSRVMANRRGPEVTEGRGNLSFTTINLPRVALKAERNLKKFFVLLDEVAALGIRQLYHRYTIQARLKVKDLLFVMGQGLYLGAADLKPEDPIAEAVKHGTLALGFIGLAEALVALTGKHHGQDEEAQQLGLEIVRFLREKIDAACEDYNLNYTLLATPAEGLAGRFVKLDCKEFGIMPGVNDREYYTNSFHIPVHFPIEAFRKIELEGPYHKFCNAGHISYVELPSPPVHNPEAVEAIVRYMAKCDMGYVGVNFPVDFCERCGFSGVLGDNCPKCNSTAIRRVRRITGYLSTVDRFNDAKVAELKARVVHLK